MFPARTSPEKAIRPPLKMRFWAEPTLLCHSPSNRLIIDRSRIEVKLGQPTINVDGYVERFHSRPGSHHFALLRDVDGNVSDTLEVIVDIARPGRDLHAELGDV